MNKAPEESLAIVIPTRDPKQASAEFSPEEISSVILRKLKRDAEKTLGHPVTKAVVTTPAYFNDKQRHATLVAAKLAGFTDCHLLPEPSAAAITFGIDDQSGKSLKTVMVFDFGGGTLDISILTLGGKKIIEQGKAGDMWLGGKDIDQILAEHLLKKAEAEDNTLQFSEILQKMPREKVLRASLEMEDLAEKAKNSTFDPSINASISYWYF